MFETGSSDAALVRGFLVTEGIVGAADDVRSIRPCSVVDDPDAEGNVVQVVLASHVELDLARFRRNLYATSSCAVLIHAAEAPRDLLHVGPRIERSRVPVPAVRASARDEQPARLLEHVPRVERLRAVEDHRDRKRHRDRRSIAGSSKRRPKASRRSRHSSVRWTSKRWAQQRRLHRRDRRSRHHLGGRQNLPGRPVRNPKGQRRLLLPRGQCTGPARVPRRGEPHAGLQTRRGLDRAARSPRLTLRQL